MSWNIMMIVIPIVVGALGTVLKGLEKRRIGNQKKNRSSKPLCCRDQLEYLVGSRRLEETFCLPDFSENPSVKAGMKNLQGV